MRVLYFCGRIVSMRYNRLNEYYKAKFGERTLKICVDGGFSCPNRDGTKGVGGCAFCSEDGSGEHIKCKDIATQVRQHLNSYRGQRANKYIVYFQNFSNTYADVTTLKQKYDSALISDKIVGLDIATRPDLITQEIVDLLATYKSKYYVMVELGLQTANANIAKDMNMQYTVQDYITACKLLHSAGIDIVTHIMLGLPGETTKDIDDTINIVNQYTDGIKIHNLYIVKNTKCAELYKHNKITILTLDEYLIKLEYVLERLRPNVVIHRICGDAPKDLLIAPEWNTHKKFVLNGIDKLMKQHNSTQGDKYKK